MVGVCGEQGRRVLLAEDNLINQTVAKKMLTVLGLVCEVACNGQEGVDAVKRGAADGRPFDCVLMDMAMPIMGGVEAARVSRPLALFFTPLGCEASPFCSSHPIFQE